MPFIAYRSRNLQRLEKINRESKTDNLELWDNIHPVCIYCNRSWAILPLVSFVRGHHLFSFHDRVCSNEIRTQDRAEIGLVFG